VNGKHVGGRERGMDRDGLYERAIASATPTGETYDLVIVGGGFAGVIAAYTFLKDTNRQRPCLLLENHPLIGRRGQAQRVPRARPALIGPQGSNETGVVTAGWLGDIVADLGLPTEFEFGKASAGPPAYGLPIDNYRYLLWADHRDNYGYFFDTPQPHWVSNPWGHNLEDALARGRAARSSALAGRANRAIPGRRDKPHEWLDTMTYAQYLTNVRKLRPEVARFVDPILASGPDSAPMCCPAVVAYNYDFPGFEACRRRGRCAVPAFRPTVGEREGRDLVPRRQRRHHAFRRQGDQPGRDRRSTSFGDVHNGRIHFEMMDRPNTPCRMRPSHGRACLNDPEKKNEPATITTSRMASSFQCGSHGDLGGGQLDRQVCGAALPEDTAPRWRASRARHLGVNVALDNWRALYQLGYTCCSWQSDLGARATFAHRCTWATTGTARSGPAHAVHALRAAQSYGLSLVDQGKVARQKMFATSYREYETQIRQQLVKLFGSAGFDPSGISPASSSIDGDTRSRRSARGSSMARREAGAERCAPPSAR